MPEFELESGNLFKALDRLKAVMEELSGPLVSTGMAVLDENRETFLGERSPGGVPWVSLKNETIRRKSGQGILRDTDKLFRSVTQFGAAGNVFRMNGNFLETGTTIRYGQIHQFGSNLVPARPFLGIGDGMIKRAGDIFHNWLEMKINDLWK